jgi:ribosomal protein L11 methyltransferase
VRTWPALEVAPGEPSTRQRLEVALVDHPVTAIGEHGDRWRLFFSTPGARDAAAGGLRRQCPDLTFRSIEVADEDWAARSQASLRAVRVGHLIVAPPWDQDGAPDAITIVIEPSMGFGTGHHATTRLCLAALQCHRPAGRTVIDVGTGSGVLAIASARLGAAGVVALDDDPDAIASARANVAVNTGVMVDVRLADVRTAALEPADLVLANLTGGLLAQAAPVLLERVRPGGYLIVSGFQGAEAAQVAAGFAPWVVRERTDEDEWSCLVLRAVPTS